VELVVAAQQNRFLANWVSQARKGVLELLVMSALSEREFYGYELVEHVARQGGMTVSDGTLYAILARLDAEGLVKTRWEAAARGPARKYYSLTKKGEQVLSGMRREWAAIVAGVSGVSGAGPA
jgi:PadR family transcriptional regulator PadR